MLEIIGDLPVKNWTEGSFSTAYKISGQAMAKSILTKRYHCAQCVVGCGRTVKVESGPYAGVDGAGPEYETVGILGSNCLIDDLEAIAMGNELCNRYGLDTIGTGGTIAFAIECFDKGIINECDTGGLKLKWADPDSMIKMIKKIAFREDIGNILAEGSRIASEKLGSLAKEIAVHVRGMEFPAHDPRAKVSNALAYATSARGACHLNAFSYEWENGAVLPELGYTETMDRFSTAEKGAFVAKFQDLMAIFDSLTGCKFVVFGLGDHPISVITEWLNYITGWNMTVEELLKTGERIVNLKRMYNVRHGQSRKDDVLPPRILTHVRGTGGAADNLPHLGKMLGEYYKYRGWDEMGIPTKETLERLGLLYDSKS